LLVTDIRCQKNTFYLNRTIKAIVKRKFFLVFIQKQLLFLIKVLNSISLFENMGEWKVGLFGCFGNVGLCLASFCVPVAVIGKSAEAIGENGALWAIATAVHPLSAAYLRFKIREKSVSDLTLYFHLLSKIKSN